GCGSSKPALDLQSTRDTVRTRSDRQFHRFFFCCRGDRRGLRSFPTRRSSDLRFVLAILTPSCSGLRACANVIRRGAVNSRPAPRDRKSTRLNSSHDQISYAVFCLKKKSTEHARG